jgi:hypothetical protein
LYVLSILNRTADNLERLRAPLTDYLVCLVRASHLTTLSDSLLVHDGVMAKDAWLAFQSNQGDRDDINSSVGIHHRTRENFVSAAFAGFPSSASVGNYPGVSYRSKWHVTGTAGTFGATSAASMAGVVAANNLWDGPFGISENFSASDFPNEAALLVDGISTVSIRTESDKETETIYSPTRINFTDFQETTWQKHK